MARKPLVLSSFAVALLGFSMFANSTLAQESDEIDTNLDRIAEEPGELQTRLLPTQIYLPGKMTFHQGSDDFIVVPTGEYIVEKFAENQLRLIPESGGEPLEIMAFAGKHEAEDIREPQALLVPVADSADCHLLLLLPGGELFDAPCTAGGVTTRDLTSPALSPASVAQEYAAYKRGIDGTLSTPSDNGDVTERGILRRPNIIATAQNPRLPSGTLPGTTQISKLPSGTLPGTAQTSGSSSGTSSGTAQISRPSPGTPSVTAQTSGSSSGTSSGTAQISRPSPGTPSGTAQTSGSSSGTPSGTAQISRPSSGTPSGTAQISRPSPGTLPGYVGTAAFGRPQYPPGTLLNAGRALTEDESMPIWRLQMLLYTANLKDAKTDDHIAISLAPGNMTYLDTPINDFERGTQVTYDLVMNGISKLSDIKYIRFYKSGSNGWCLGRLILVVNGKYIFHYDPGANGHWLDPGENANWQSVPVLWFTSNQLRSHDLWRRYRQPDYPYSMSFRELITRVYAAYGQHFGYKKWKWGSDGSVFVAGQYVANKLPAMFIGDSVDSPDEVRVAVRMEEEMDNWSNNRWTHFMDMKWSIAPNGYVRVRLNDMKAYNNGNWMSTAVFVGKVIYNFSQQNYFKVFASMLTCDENVCSVERPLDNSYMDMVLPIRADFISIHQVDLSRGYIQFRQAPAGMILW